MFRNIDGSSCIKYHRKRSPLTIYLTRLIRKEDVYRENARLKRTRSINEHVGMRQQNFVRIQLYPSGNLWTRDVDIDGRKS